MWGAVLALKLAAGSARAEAPQPAPVAPPAERPTQPSGDPASPTPAPPAPRTGWRVQGLPIANYNSDEGLGYGARVMLVDAADGTYSPYRYAVVAQFFQTTLGVAQHRLQLDAVRFLDSPWRVGLEFNLLKDRFSPYFGEAGDSAYEPDFSTCEDRDALETDPDVCPGNPSFRGLRYYSFEQRTLPSVVLNLRRPLSGPWQLAVGYRFRYTTVSTRYDADDLGQLRDSRLEEDVRAGRIVGVSEADLGEDVSFRTGELTMGLLLDMRDNEPAPVRGMFHEVTLRAAAGVTGSSYGYWGATANLRFYHPVLDDRLVAALRLVADALSGDVPFFLLSSFGGVEWRDGWSGIGGVYTARGLLKNRLQGKVKALANGELRWKFASVSPGGQQLDFTLVAFMDAGQAWTDLSLAEGSELGYGGGGGLRIAWERNFIVRIDYGRSPSDDTSGFYLNFNHLF